jgi:tetratricopeptide (TPR) repeat protein
MMRPFPQLCLFAAAAFAMVPGTGARSQDIGQWSRDLRDCFISANLQTSARGCNAVIEAGTDMPDLLARAYWHRGGVRLVMGADGRILLDHNIERAIADFTEAIRLAPTLVAAYAARGRAWAAKGDRERALADYDEAIRLRLADRDDLFSIPRTDLLYIERELVFRDQADVPHAR